MNKPKYYISAANEFVIENYNVAPTFASFFPGIAGIFGCPMWVFYCNRGQGITSMGVNDKDDAIMEFHPANKAYRAVSLQGYRTFIKVNGEVYEPFSERSQHTNRMKITEHGFRLEETNQELKLKVEVDYFNIVNEQFPALARVVKVTNLANKPREIELVDGLPIIIPFGFIDTLLKRLSQTIEAWCIVDNLANGAPFFRLKVMPADVAETKLIEKGHFYIAFAGQQGKEAPVSLIVDRSIVFDENSSLEIPRVFQETKNFKVPKKQIMESTTPSAMSYKQFSLKAKEEVELFSLVGQVNHLRLLQKLKDKVSSRGYFSRKEKENRELIDSICCSLDIKSSSKSFDLYSRQTFLDNVLRGGMPITMGNKVIYAYYRKHGDMERDYNDFKLMPTYFSQGTGNYRDINQNRRNDLFVNPDLGDENIMRFFNLVQLDGFNPLVVLGSKYRVLSFDKAKQLVAKHLKEADPAMAEVLVQPFLLGGFLKKLDEFGIAYQTSRQAFACELLENSVPVEASLHGEGFWIDHFSYNTDLLESFEAIYPDRLNHLLFKKKDFTYFDNDRIVAGRRQKYALSEEKVRQYGAVKFDQEKSALLNGRQSDKNIVRTENGAGDPYYTTLAAKIICILANKTASFDAAGIGLEMEADKPDWYDALNGLPGLLGSSLSETLELKRLAVYLQSHLTEAAAINLPSELNELIAFLEQALGKFFDDQDNFHYWDTTATAKENYRRAVRLGIAGGETVLTTERTKGFLSLVIRKCDAAVKQCRKQHGNYFTYFINEMSEYDQRDGVIFAKKFVQKPLPLFLEGFVHALKVEKDKKIYKLVKASPLFDQELKMYKVNAPLMDAPIEIGRARVFTRGWLENESIWLHMEYKYMLEVLKASLYKEFFADIKHVLVPFMNPAKYKRSTLENSSFIASSAHPNINHHGRGFVARLSGGAAEFIDLWLFMTTGKKIFSLDDKGKLVFMLAPILPAWLFHKGALSFTLLGAIEVTYLNPKKKDTFGSTGAKPKNYKLVFENGREVEVKGPVIAEPYARQIRDRKVRKIIVNLV